MGLLQPRDSSDANAGGLNEIRATITANAMLGSINFGGDIYERDVNR